jgi:hypothetical protein
VVVTREAFEKVGGFDTGFVGWGFEDTAFVYVVEAEYGKMPPRGKGALVHLWHPPAADQGNPSQESEARFNALRAERGLAPWRRGTDR